MKLKLTNHLLNGNADYSTSITIEEMARQTCMPVEDVNMALKELEEKNLITAVRHPLMIPRYIINLDEVERLATQSQPRGEA
jgi:DNA-binding MarR family transcriptional regulator